MKSKKQVQKELEKLKRKEEIRRELKVHKQAKKFILQEQDDDTKKIILETRKLSDLDIRMMPFGNRDIKPKHSATLRVQVREGGILRDMVIIYTNVFGDGWHWYIMDGQHLYYALKALGYLDKCYVKVYLKPVDNIIDLVTAVSTMNATQKKWVLKDYLYNYADTKLMPDYVTLVEKIKLYGLTTQITAVIYGGISSNVASRMIKNGTFKIVDKRKGNQVCRDIGEILDIFGATNHTLTRVFANAFYYWYNAVNYDAIKTKAYILKNKDKFEFLKKDGMSLLLGEIK